VIFAAAAVAYFVLQSTVLARKLAAAVLLLAAIPIRLRLCLVPRNFAKFFNIPHHIESLDACMKH
jgi:hypothetical protein